jgi:hypothetical protein
MMLGGGRPVHACGHCKEDRIAATYDYAVVSAARRNGQAVVFAELRGAIGPTTRLGDWIRQQAETSTGVVHGTVRVSLEPAAVSFVCDRQAVAITLRSIGQRLARRGFGLRLIEAQTASNVKSRDRP